MPNHTKAIIWDLGGVLFEPSIYRVLLNIGLLPILKHVLYNRTYPRIKTDVFSILQQLELHTLTLINTVDQQVPLYDSSNTQLPPCMTAWLTGTVTSFELIAHAHAHIEQLAMQQYFTNFHEKNLVKQAISILFHPVHFAQYMRPVKAGLKLLRKCARVPSNKLILLSNWDAQSFNFLAQSAHGQRVLQYFKPEHRVISGLLGYAKPDKRCFHYLLTHYNLKPQDCIFIDDQQENILQAEKQGFTCLWLQQKNYTALEQLLKLYTII